MSYLKSVKLLKKYDINFDMDLFNDDIKQETEDVIIDAKKVIVENGHLIYANGDVRFLDTNCLLPSRDGDELSNNFMNVKQLIEQILINIPERDNNDTVVIGKYFNYWKKFLEDKKEMMNSQHEMANQREKLHNFIKKMKRLKSTNNVGIRTTCDNDEKEPNSIDNNTKDTKVIRIKSNEKMTKKIDSSNYKNRYKAQQDIIEMQKIKLVQQNKLIEDLKFGKITEELSKSLETSKNDIREIFAKSSTRTKCKIVPLIEDVENVKNFQLKINKAPKIVQGMERRAEERALRRQIILERKRIIDEEKKRIAELILEEKRIQDEEEKNRTLEAMKERRRKELQTQKIRQRNKEIYNNNLNKATYLYHTKLKSSGFRSFRLIMYVKNENEKKSLKYYTASLKRKYFSKWLKLHADIEEKTNEKADTYYRNKMLNKYMELFKLILKRKKQSMQVACDIYDLKLEINFFTNWHRYVCKRYVINHKNNELAKKHYNKRLLWQHFYQWRKLSAVIQLDRAKEQKLRKWREKVWDIIPDFRPEDLD